MKKRSTIRLPLKPGSIMMVTNMMPGYCTAMWASVDEMMDDRVDSIRRKSDTFTVISTEVGLPNKEGWTLVLKNGTTSIGWVWFDESLDLDDMLIDITSDRFPDRETS